MSKTMGRVFIQRIVRYWVESGGPVHRRRALLSGDSGWSRVEGIHQAEGSKETYSGGPVRVRNIRYSDEEDGRPCRGVFIEESTIRCPKSQRCSERTRC